jgi:hypothetical protein
MKNWINGILILCLGYLFGCSQSDVTTTVVEKDSLSPSSSFQAPSSDNEIKWTAPSSWQRAEPSAFQIANFTIKGKSGGEAHASIVPLMGEAGGLLPNINRWRGQIGLAPIGEEKIKDISRKITVNGQTLTLVTLTSAAGEMGSEQKSRLVVAILKRGEKTWFFKLLGDEAVVTETEPTFLEFLKTIQFNDQK